MIGRHGNGKVTAANADRLTQGDVRVARISAKKPALGQVLEWTFLVVKV